MVGRFNFFQKHCIHYTWVIIITIYVCNTIIMLLHIMILLLLLAYYLLIFECLKIVQEVSKYF